MSLEVADLTAALGLNSRSFDRGMATAEGKAKSGSKAIGLALGGVAAAGGALLVKGLTDSVSAATKFQTTMSGVKAVSGASADQMSKLNALALKLGKDTTFSASDAGDALEELVKGGVSIQDIMSGAAKSTLDLAAAGGVDLPTAAEIASNAMNIFGISGKKMAHVADQIAGAANASSLDVMDFKFSLSASGAVAKAMGFNFDDLSVAIAEMGAAGLKGSDAGTSLKTMFLALNPKSDAAAGAMRDLGIITKDGANRFFDAAGHVKKLADVQEILRTATAKMTDQQRTATLETIFGTDAIRAASILTNDGAAGYDKMATSMGKVTAASVAATRLDNLNGKMQALSGSIETLEITVGTALIPTLADLADKATGVANGFIDFTQSLPPGVLELATKIAAVTGAALALGGGMAILSTTMGPIGGVIAAAIGAISLPVIALGVAAAGLVVAWKNDWGGIRETAKAAWQGILPAFTAIHHAIDAVVGAFKMGGMSAAGTAALGQARSLLGRLGGWIIGTALPAITNQLATWGRAFVGWVAPRVGPLLAQLGNLLGRVGGWVMNKALPEITAKLTGWGESFVAWVGPRIGPLLAQLGSLATRFWGWITAQTAPLRAQLAQWANAFVAWVVPTTETFLQRWPGLLNRFLDWIGGAAVKLGKALLPWAGKFIGWVAPLIPPLLKGLAGVAAALGIFVVETGATLGIKLGQWGFAFVAWVAPHIKPMLGELAKLVARLGAWIITDGIPKLAGFGLKMGQSLLSGLKDGITGGLGDVKDAIAGVGSGLMDHFKNDKNVDSNSPSLAYATVGADMMAGLQQGITDGSQGIQDALTANMSDAMGVMSDQVSAWTDAGASLAQGLIDGITGMSSTVTDTISSLGDDTIAALKDLLGIASPSKVFFDIGVNTIAGFIGGVTARAGALFDAVASAFRPLPGLAMGVGGAVAGNARTAWQLATQPGFGGTVVGGQAAVGRAILVIHDGIAKAATATHQATLAAHAKAKAATATHHAKVEAEQKKRTIIAQAMAALTQGGTISRHAGTFAEDTVYRTNVAGIKQANALARQGLTQTMAALRQAGTISHQATSFASKTVDSTQRGLARQTAEMARQTIAALTQAAGISGRAGRFADATAARTRLALARQTAATQQRVIREGLATLNTATRLEQRGGGDLLSGRDRTLAAAQHQALTQRRSVISEALAALRQGAALSGQAGRFSDNTVSSTQLHLAEQARHAAVVARAAARHQEVLAATAKRHADHLARLAADAQGVADRKAARAAASSVTTTSGTRITAHAPALAVAGLPSPSGSSGGAVSITVNISPHAIEVNGGGGIDDGLPEDLANGLVEYTRALLQSRKNAGRRAAVSMPGAR